MTWLEVLTGFAERSLDDRVRAALYSRGVTDEQMALYRIGYLDRNLPALEGAEDFLRWSHQGQRLEDVLVLPLTNALGIIHGFQFRHVDRARKGYLDYLPYKEESVLFGLGQAMPRTWETGGIWLVEGAFDLFPLQRHVPNIVATLTARVPENLIRVIRRLVSQVWIGYDSDSAGQSAMAHFSKQYGREFRVHPVYYPRVQVLGSDRLVKDPGELWEAWGDDQIASFLQTVIRSTDPEEMFNA